MSRREKGNPVKTCAHGHHHAYAVPGREGHWFWACHNCGAVREQNDPTWRIP